MGAPEDRGRGIGNLAARAALAGLAGLLAALAAGSASAGVVFARRFDASNGLSVSYCSNVLQDAHGFLWIGTPGGVFRYDGQAFRLVIPLNATPIGGTASESMILRDADGRLWRAAGDAASPLEGPDGRPADGVRFATFTGDGALWAMFDRRLERLAPGGVWQPVDLEPGPEIGLLFADRGETVLAVTDDALLRITPGGRTTTLARAADPVAVRSLADGSIVFGCADGSVHLWAAGKDKALFHEPHRLIDVVRRGETFWAAYDSGIVAERDGAPPEWVTPAIGAEGGGPLLVDREGSLWVATPFGLVQMPEPDTRMAEETGGGRSFAVTQDALWHALWGGLHRTPRGPASASWQRVPSGSIYPPCVDAEGRVWQAGDDLFRVWDARGGMHAVRAPGLRGNWRCSASDDGSIWIPTNLGVFRLEAGDDAPRLVVRSIPGEDRGTPRGYRAFESPGGDLFVARGDRVCRAAVRQVEGDGRPEWTCQEVPGAGSWEGFAAMPSGDTWAAVGGRGFFRHRGGRWEPIPGSARLASQWTSSITRNADGTAWLTGCGYAVRAAERPGEPDGWEIVEQPGAWQGVWKTRVADAIEDSDGGVWLSVDIGVLEVPAGVRRAAVPPPAVALAEASIDGRPLPVAEALRLPHHRNRLELRFAAASYRDPSLLRYRSRLRPDEPWSPPTANPLFRFVDVAPGEYRVEVEATLDGVRWSPQPALFSFSVGRPWYLEPWVFLAALAAAAGAAYAVHRTRIAVLVRLERQRARIAMDLHDELGSGLGTIGILAGVAARPGVDAERRWALVERIGHVSRQLGDSLTDMVRTLRPGAANTASLAAHLRERGEAMFPGPEPRLEVDLPDPVPVVPLSLAVRRNVALLGLEVLHNAATHAGARKVTLSLVPGRRFWTLSVSDDGRGLGEAGPPAPGHGSGLDGMRWRAEAIGARLEIAADPSRGTRVRLEFEPDSVERDIPERGKRQRTAGRSRGSAG